MHHSEDSEDPIDFDCLLNFTLLSMSPKHHAQVMAYADLSEKKVKKVRPLLTRNQGTKKVHNSRIFCYMVMIHPVRL